MPTLEPAKPLSAVELARIGVAFARDRVGTFRRMLATIDAERARAKRLLDRARDTVSVHNLHDYSCRFRRKSSFLTELCDCGAAQDLEELGVE